MFNQLEATFISQEQAIVPHSVLTENGVVGSRVARKHAKWDTDENSLLYDSFFVWVFKNQLFLKKDELIKHRKTWAVKFRTSLKINKSVRSIEYQANKLFDENSPKYLQKLYRNKKSQTTLGLELEKNQFKKFSKEEMSALLCWRDSGQFNDIKDYSKFKKTIQKTDTQIMKVLFLLKQFNISNVNAIPEHCFGSAGVSKDRLSLVLSKKKSNENLLTVQERVKETKGTKHVTKDWSELESFYFRIFVSSLRKLNKKARRLLESVFETDKRNIKQKFSTGKERSVSEEKEEENSLSWSKSDYQCLNLWFSIRYKVCENSEEVMCLLPGKTITALKAEIRKIKAVRKTKLKVKGNVLMNKIREEENRKKLKRKKKETVKRNKKKSKSSTHEYEHDYEPSVNGEEIDDSLSVTYSTKEIVEENVVVMDKFIGFLGLSSYKEPIIIPIVGETYNGEVSSEPRPKEKSDKKRPHYFCIGRPGKRNKFCFRVSKDEQEAQKGAEKIVNILLVNDDIMFEVVVKGKKYEFTIEHMEKNYKTLYYCYIDYLSNLRIEGHDYGKNRVRILSSVGGSVIKQYCKLTKGCRFPYYAARAVLARQFNLSSDDLSDIVRSVKIDSYKMSFGWNKS